VVLNHQKARVQVGGEVGIPKFERNETTGSLEVSGFDPRNFGIVLNVVPHVTSNKEIRVDVQPEVTSFLGFIPIGGTNLASPQFETIVAKTDVMVNSGDTLVIGGLIGNDEDDSRSKVPYINRVPLLGWLFKSVRREPQQNRKTETIFFVTVTLVDKVFNQDAVKKWRKTQQDYDNFRKNSEEEFFNKRAKKEEEKAAKESAKG
jgi:type II secretory pathway component GspD/PulD (secretin)